MEKSVLEKAFNVRIAKTHTLPAKGLQITLQTVGNVMNNVSFDNALGHWRVDPKIADVFNRYHFVIFENATVEDGRSYRLTGENPGQLNDFTSGNYSTQDPFHRDNFPKHQSLSTIYKAHPDHHREMPTYFSTSDAVKAAYAALLTEQDLKSYINEANNKQDLLAVKKALEAFSDPRYDFSLYEDDNKANTCPHRLTLMEKFSACTQIISFMLSDEHICEQSWLKGAQAVAVFDNKPGGCVHGRPFNVDAKSVVLAGSTFVL